MRTCKKGAFIYASLAVILLMGTGCENSQYNQTGRPDG